jgi:iron complex outermembrane receptor protein
MNLTRRAHRARLLSLLAASSTTALPALAADQPTATPVVVAEATQLSTVTVRGARPQALTVPSIDDARAATDAVAGGAGVIDADSYKDGRASTLKDALGYAPGVFVQPRFGAEEARLSIRGSGAQRTFHGRGLTLLQDGAPLNLADGSFDFQAVEPLAADYVEIWRGANALEYGSATLGGAINFVSPTGYSAPRLQARAEAGSFGYRRGQLAAGGSTGNVDGYASLTGLHATGFRSHAQQDNTRLFSNLGVRILPTLESRLYLTYVNAQSALPGSLTRAEADATPSLAAPANLSGDQKRDFSLLRIADRTSWLLGEGRRLDGSVFYAQKRLFHPIFQVINQDNHDTGLDLHYGNTRALFGHGNRLVAGTRVLYGQTQEKDFANVAGQNGAQTDASRQTARSVALYAEEQCTVVPQWTVALGAQGLFDRRNKRDLFVPASSTDTSFKRDYTGFSPKLGLRYDHDQSTQLFANISRSFEPPSFAELTGGQITSINSPQRGTTVEVGGRVRQQALSLDVALYRAWLKDELLALNDANGQPLGTVNAPKTIHQGIELAASAQLPYQFAIGTAYLLNDFRFDGDPIYRNNRIAGLPVQQLRSELSWTSHWLTAGPNVEWVPAGGWIDQANSYSSDGYAILGFRLSGKLAGEHWAWFVDGRNLTDEHYTPTTGVIANAAGRDQRQFLPGDGRSVYAGLSWNSGP